MGRPIIQFPQDVIAMQELIWEIKPNLIIETGIAHGGSIIFYASMLELLGNNSIVLGIDIDIRAHNRVEIEKQIPQFLSILGSEEKEEIKRNGFFHGIFLLIADLVREMVMRELSKEK